VLLFCCLAGNQVLAAPPRSGGTLFTFWTVARVHHYRLAADSTFKKLLRSVASCAHGSLKYPESSRAVLYAKEPAVPVK